MKKTVEHKKFEITIEVDLNSVVPLPPSFMDTAVRHSVKAYIIHFGWVYEKKVSDQSLSGEIGIAEREAREFIDEKTKKIPAKVKAKTDEHIDKLTSKGFS